MSAKINILFWVRKSRSNAKGDYPIMARITIHGERKDFFTGINVSLNEWNETKLRLRGKSDDIQVKNETLDGIEVRLRKIFNRLAEEGSYVTVYDVHAAFTGKDSRNVTLVQLLTEHNDKYRKRLQTDRSLATYRKYVVTAERITEFLHKEKKLRDIPLRSIKPQFIQDFQQFLLGEHQNHHNTVVKHVKNFKRFMNYAVEQQWLDRNPFTVFKCGYKETEQAILTEAELETIYRKKFTIERLETTRNLFLLQCYTGLAYTDMYKLQHKNLQEGNDGKMWLYLNRTKTDVPVNLPLLSRAYDIIRRLQPKHIPGGDGKLLPVISNQKMNAYLKEIADLCGIRKKLSTHVGRRTMATTVLLSNGVPVETISKILGHLKISTTQVYAKVKDVQVQREMNRVENLLG